MKKIISKDGTTIAFDQMGKGPALILVEGALEQRAMDSEYEAPYNDDEAARLAWKAYRKQLADVLAQGRRDDALALFMLLVGMPADHLDQVRQHPLWPMWEAAAPTLAYDAAAMGEDASVPTEKAASVAVPALIMDGSASYLVDWLKLRPQILG